MITWTQTFLTIAFTAALLGFSGVAGTSFDLVWLLAVATAVALAVVSAVAEFVAPERTALMP